MPSITDDLAALLKSREQLGVHGHRVRLEIGRIEQVTDDFARADNEGPPGPASDGREWTGDGAVFAERLWIYPGDEFIVGRSASLPGPFYFPFRGSCTLVPEISGERLLVGVTTPLGTIVATLTLFDTGEGGPWSVYHVHLEADGPDVVDVFPEGVVLAGPVPVEFQVDDTGARVIVGAGAVTAAVTWASVPMAPPEGVDSFDLSCLPPD